MNPRQNIDVSWLRQYRHGTVKWGEWKHTKEEFWSVQAYRHTHSIASLFYSAHPDHFSFLDTEHACVFNNELLDVLQIQQMPEQINWSSEYSHFFEK